MLAASFGVTEVFKRVYGVPVDVASPMENVAFSLFELNNEFQDYGPQLPTSISLPNTLVLGAGAIGNGLVLLLSQLPLHGRVLLMDKQNFGAENYGTCTLLDLAEWIGKPKAKMLANWLRPRSVLEIQDEMSTIETALDENVFKHPVNLVINGLDDVAARRAVQKLWPSLLVDGGINSAGAAVVTYSTAHRKFSCLRCNFTDANGDAEALQAKATGLDRSSFEGDPNRLITDEDIGKADESARAWLREQQRTGQTICSTISAGMASRLGLALAKDFRPSVPFVATASAALVIAQVLRNLLWPEQKFIHEFQFSSLFVGASTGVRLGRLASPDCECTKNSKVIDAIIASRCA
jgi:molybdopterin/thiamine biosynthesis adenylyltransferase